MTNPPPTPKSPVKNPTAVPAASTTSAERTPVRRGPKRAAAADAVDGASVGLCRNAVVSPTLVQVGQPVTMRQAAMHTSPAKDSSRTSGSMRWLSAEPAKDPPMPVSPNTTPVPTRTRPARQCDAMPTNDAIPTRRRLVVVALRAGCPAP